MPQPPSSRSRRLVAKLGWILLAVNQLHGTADALSSHITCATVNACISVDGTNCTKNCPPCITQAPSGILACVSRVAAECPVTASTACDGVGIFAPNNTIDTSMLEPTNSLPTLPPPIVNNVSSVLTPVPESSASSTSSITPYLAISAGVSFLVLCIMLVVRHKRATSRQSIASPLGRTPNASDKFMPHAPLSLVTVPTAASQKGPSRAFFGDKTSAEGDPDVLGSSASSVTSFQTASSAGFSHSIFQQQPKHLLSTSSSLSSVSSVFHVAPSPRTHPHAKRVTSTVVEHEVMMDPWDDDPMQHKQRLRDESVVMMVEGDEEDDVFDHDENAMRTTTVMDNGRLFSECSSRFSILSDSNDTKI